jgi:hypothetical protein
VPPPNNALQRTVLAKEEARSVRAGNACPVRALIGQRAAAERGR